MTRYASIFVVALAGTLAAAAVFFMVQGWERQSLEKEFAVESEVIYIDMLSAYRRSLVLLESLHGFFAATSHVSKDEFTRFSAPLLAYTQGIQALEWIPRVPAREREAYEKELNRSRLETSRFTEQNQDGTLQPAGERDFYYPVYYLEPLSGNERSLGFDLGSNPVRRDALYKAADTGLPVASGRITLVQETDRQYGFLLFRPVYAYSETIRSSSPVSLENTRGFIIFVYRVGDFFGAALSELKFKGISVFINDMDAPEGERFLYGWKSSEKHFQQALSGLHKKFSLAVGQREWEVTCAPLPEFYERFQTRYALTASGSVLLITLLLTAYLFTTIDRTERVRAEVHQRTSDLNEYVRQLDCLYGISSLMEQTENSVEGVLARITELIPSAFVMPETMQASITYREETYGASPGDDGATIAVEEIGAPEPVGELRLGLVNEGGKSGLQALSQTEQTLLKSIATQIGTYVERKETERILVDARDLAEKAAQAKSEFLANMSHEIRTPLNAIIGLAEVVKKAGLKPRQLDYFNKIQSASQSLLGIVNDVLDFSRIEAGKLVFEESVMELAEVLTSTLEVYAPKAADKGIRLDLITGPGLPACVVGDALRLKQVLANLLSNAIKFTEKGEVELKVTPRKSDTGSESATGINIRIRDTGMGISPSKQFHLFEAFTQVDGSHTRRHGGTGLGLTITRQLVGLMNGTIAVESELDVGSTFILDLEFATAAPSPLPEPHPALEGKRALLAGTISENDKTTTEILEAFGFEVDSEKDGAAAFSRVTAAAGKNPYDLVWSHWKMSSLNGLELSRNIRKQVPEEQLPKMVLATGFFTDEVLSASESLFDRTLLRPVSRHATVTAVEEIFDLSGNEKVVSDRAAVRGGRLLVAEDNSINRQVIRELLEDAGVSVTMAANGREAVEIIRASEVDAFDAALMDIQMPIMDGIEATRLIRESRDSVTLPIIALTAHVMVEDRSRCFEAGMNDYVAKPLDVKKLFHVLAKWMDLGGKRRAPLPEVEGDNGGKHVFIPPIDGIDIEAGLERLGGKSEVYQRLLLEFLKDYADLVEIIRQLLRSGDVEHAGRLVHTAKGVAGNIGAEAVHDTAAELEQTLKEGYPYEAPIEDLETAINAVVAGLEQYRSRLEANGSDQTPCDIEPGSGQFEEKMLALSALLAANDFKAVRAFGKIAEDLSCSIPPETATVLGEKITAFDFKGAAGMLEQIMNDLEIDKPE